MKSIHTYKGLKMLDNKIKIHVKNEYGIEKLYPQCKNSFLLTDLLNVKSFEHYHLIKLKSLGYDIQSDSKELIKMLNKS